MMIIRKYEDTRHESRSFPGVDGRKYRSFDAARLAQVKESKANLKAGFSSKLYFSD
jgi:hypothetical protein